MWQPLSKQPSWLTRGKKRGREGDQDWRPPHLMQVAKTEILEEKLVEMNGLEIGHASMQGFRVTMEDSYIIEQLDKRHTLVAILDGHAGQGAAIIASTT